MSILNRLHSRINYYDPYDTYPKATKEEIAKIKQFASIDLP